MAAVAACLLLTLQAVRGQATDDAGMEDCVDDLCSLASILTMPPPPIPLFMLSMFNESLDPSEGCNFCRFFPSDSQEDVNGSGFLLPRPSDKSSSSPSASDGMTSVLVACVLGLSFGFLLLGMIWCKKWRHFPVKDTCPVFSDGLFSGHRKAPPPPPSPTESVMSPVVNEKSPQSIIMDHGTTGKKSVIQTKYWRRGSDFTIDASSSVLRPHRHADHYGGDTGSCTSSPVYAELDGLPVHGAYGGMGSNLLTCPAASSISPYAVGMNTYSELPDTNSMRMTNMASSSATALLPDSSYDNAAYLPNVNVADQQQQQQQQQSYGVRSLRRPTRIAGGMSGQPLLHASGSHHQFTAQVVSTSSPSSSSSSAATAVHAHLASASRKKHRNPHHTLAHQLARNSVQRTQEMIDQIDELSSGERSRFPVRRGPASSQSFMDAGGMPSPSMTTFKSASPYASYVDRSQERDSKRPLPPVPGIRL